MKIAVVGTGYVGLVTGVCFADLGNEVTGIDIDENKIASLKQNKLPIYEPDLEQLFKRSAKEGRLNFTTNLKEGIKDAQVIFLALPTPPKDDGSADLSYILGVAEDLGPIINQYVVVVDKSTVPVGTAEKVRAAIAKTAKTDFDVVSNPEFLREGLAVADFMKPDRIVIGSTSKKAKETMAKLYEPFVQETKNIIYMDERSAEMTKYAANAFLAMKISFMNEIANLSELAGADVDDIRRGIGADERIGHRFLFPGIGYGGSCFPKDVQALQKTAQDYNYDFQILKSVTNVNYKQKKVLFNKLNSYFKGNLNGKTFGLWGLAFKPNTDDIREAPAVDLINMLANAGAKVLAYDPEAANNIRKHFGDNKSLKIVDSQYDAIAGADALLIATEWDEFKALDFTKLSKLKNKLVFDGRNLYDPKDMAKQGLHYESIGRQVVNAKK